ncbi:formin-like protein 20 [Parus major]|uniref:formin-like protein 20 n=1 Tax=Parus major TaxID=9157 RepID=UPI0014444FCB|nr:formin-like protein 20 [Parus major]
MRGLAHNHRHAPLMGEPRGGGCAAPGARAPPLPRHCPRYATGNGAGALRRLFLSPAKCRRRGNTGAQPPEKFMPPGRETGASGKTPGHPVSETELARVPGLPFRQPVGLRTGNCHRSERPTPPRASGPAPPRQGDSGDARLGFGEAQRAAPGSIQKAPRDPIPPGPARPWPPPRPRRYLPPALPPVRLSAPPPPHARRHPYARAPAPAPPIQTGFRRAAPLRPARGHGLAASREHAQERASAFSGLGRRYKAVLRRDEGFSAEPRLEHEHRQTP